jgi:L-cysteine desulfidase
MPGSERKLAASRQAILSSMFSALSAAAFQGGNGISAAKLQYIIRLIGQVITVSVETVKIVKSLPELKFE